VSKRQRWISAGAALVALLTSGCSDTAETKCAESGNAKICFVRDAAGAGSLEVSGLEPGSILTMESEEMGESSYPINDAGELDGKVGVLNSTGASIELTVTGTTASGQPLVGSFES
jgi:hypothetical protein